MIYYRTSPETIVAKQDQPRYFYEILNTICCACINTNMFNFTFIFFIF